MRKYNSELRKKESKVFSDSSTHSILVAHWLLRQTRNSIPFRQTSLAVATVLKRTGRLFFVDFTQISFCFDQPVGSDE
jgi:hypothetical protein